MKHFAKIVHNLKKLTIFAKRYTLDVWQGSEYTYARAFQIIQITKRMTQHLTL